jgi:hypothetical protein
MRMHFLFDKIAHGFCKRAHIQSALSGGNKGFYRFLILRFFLFPTFEGSVSFIWSFDWGRGRKPDTTL